MASNETILAWKAELLGADSVKDGLRKINEEVKKGTLSDKERNEVVKETTKDFRNLRAEQTLLTRSFQAAHPQLATLTRTMSTFGNIARTGLNIANSLNIMWIRQNQTAIALSEANYEVAKATRDLNLAREKGNPLKIAEAEERLNMALEKQSQLKTGDFWTNLTDVATVGLTITTAVSTVFTNLMKNPTIAGAVIRAGSFLGGIFSGFFTLVSKAGVAVLDWLFPTLTGKNAMTQVGRAGTTMGSIYGLSFIAAMATAGALAAYYLIPEIEKSFSEYNKKKAKETGQEINAPGSQFVTKDVYIKNKIATVKPAADALQSLIDLFTKGLPEAFGSTETGVQEQVSIWQPIIDLFTVGIPDAIKILQDGFMKGWQGITDLTNVFGAGLVSGVNSIFKSLINSMNSAISSYNKAAKKMGKSTISSLTFTPNQFTPIPMPSIKAATGFNGMINRPTLFLAGEAGPESVSISPNGTSNGGGITVVVNVQGSILTERELFRRVDENLKNELKRRNFRILQ